MLDAVCTICRSGDAAPRFTVDGWHIVRCRSCGHQYVSPRPSMDDVHQIYDESYFQNPAFATTDHDAYFGYMDYLRDRENIQKRLTDVLRRVERHQPRGRLLDVGCGLGFFVEVAMLGGWDAWGIDLNKHAVEWANEHVSEHVHYGTVDHLTEPDGSFDCVTMFDVIEHLDDPAAEIREISRVLRPGGLLVVVTPDAGSVMAKILRGRWLEMKRAPEHLHFFDKRGLGRLLDEAGLDAFESHSIGKITTLRTVLADLKFYSPRVFGGIERVLEKRGLADRVVDLDPRTKMCVYARKR